MTHPTTQSGAALPVDTSERWSVNAEINRRMFAAHHACTGIPTAALEAGVVQEMLAVLLDAVELAHGMSFSREPMISTWGQRVEHKVRAVLAKAEGRT